MVPTRVILGFFPPGGGVVPGDRAGTHDTSRACEPCGGAGFGDANAFDSPTTSSVTSATVVSERADPSLEAPPSRAASTEPSLSRS